MAYENPILAPVDTWIDGSGDVQTVLGETSGDWDVLCTSQNINKWAKYKPIEIDIPTEITETDRQNANYGLDLHEYRTLPALIRDVLDMDNGAYKYIRPSTWFRILDFEGYRHDAVFPWINFQLEKVGDTSLRLKFNGGEVFSGQNEPLVDMFALGYLKNRGYTAFNYAVHLGIAYATAFNSNISSANYIPVSSRYLSIGELVNNNQITIPLSLFAYNTTYYVMPVLYTENLDTGHTYNFRDEQGAGFWFPLPATNTTSFIRTSADTGIGNVDVDIISSDLEHQGGNSFSLSFIRFEIFNHTSSAKNINLLVKIDTAYNANYEFGTGSVNVAANSSTELIIWSNDRDTINFEAESRYTVTVKVDRKVVGTTQTVQTEYNLVDYEFEANEK